MAEPKNRTPLVVCVVVVLGVAAAWYAFRSQDEVPTPETPVTQEQPADPGTDADTEGG
jgi:hypothetical protein